MQRGYALTFCGSLWFSGQYYNRIPIRLPFDDDMLPAYRVFTGQAQSLERSFLRGETRGQVTLRMRLSFTVIDLPLVKPSPEEPVTMTLQQTANPIRLYYVYPRTDDHTVTLSAIRNLMHAGYTARDEIQGVGHEQ